MAGYGVIIEPFRKNTHDRSHFDCDSPQLNHYIHKQVSLDLRRNLARCFAAVHPDYPGRLAGYYILSAYSLERDVAAAEDQGMPYTAVPAVLIGRLAVCRHFQGRGVARALMVDAFQRILAIHENAGIRVVVVDPLGEDVVGLYRKFGFQELTNGQLILPVKTLIASVDKK